MRHPRRHGPAVACSAPPCRPRRRVSSAPGLGRVAALAVVVVVAVAACTGGGPRSPRTGGGATAGPGGPPRQGGSLAIALLAPASLDPARAERSEEQTVVASLFDGLTAVDAHGAVQGAVAGSWTADEALRRWTFKLRPGSRFSEGTPVQAGDFKFAWERLVDPRTGLPAALGALLAPVEGYQALAAGRARGLAGVAAPDPATLVVELDQPFADFPAVVANPRLSPLPRALVGRDPAAYWARPVGNGPFTLTRPWVAGRPFELARNPAYAGRAAYLDKVRVDAVPDEQTAWLEFQDGLVSFAPVPLDQLGAAAAVYGRSPDGRTQPGVLLGPELATWSVGFNLRAKPFSDPAWRQAFSLALDRERIAGGFAGARAASAALVPDGVPDARRPACPACRHAPQEASRLLRQAGARNPRVTLTLPDDPLERQAAKLVAASLAGAGVAVRLDPVPPAGYLAAVRRPGVQAFALGWTADYPRMDAFLFPQFGTGGQGDLTGFADPAVTRLLAQARATADQQRRTQLYQQAEDALLAQLPVAPVLAARHAAVLATGLRGFDDTPAGPVDLAAVSLAN
jgi:oligopeptide transport system substrate-binding protein